MKKSIAALCGALLLLIPLLFISASSQSCSSYKFTGNTVYNSCVDLPVLSSFLHWNFNQSTSTAEIAFRRTGSTSSQWVSWAINPTGRGMIGCQALVAYLDSATGSTHAYTSPITSYDTAMPEGSLSFGVPSISATFVNGEMTIFAKLQLASGTASVNQVWQEGPMKNGKPATHPTGGANGRSMGTLSFVAGATSGGGSSGTGDGDADGDDGGSSGSTSSGGSSPFSSLQRRKNVHGVLNAVSWGTLMPMGVIIARYLKVFEGADPAWFYLHVTCQTSAYILGVAGWATGLKLGDSGGETGYHGPVGAVLFIGGTLQVFALLLRPKKDHKYRLFWNIYHHSIGYTIVVLSIVNVFKGLEILDPSKFWKRAYVTILIVLGSLAVLLEAVTWYIVVRRRRSAADPPKHPSLSMANGYGSGRSYHGA